MSESAITLLKERPQNDSAALVVNPRSLELGWLENKDLRAASVRLANGIKHTPPEIIQPEAWRVFLDKLAAENIYSADRIVSVTTNSGMGLHLAIILYSKSPREVIFVGPDGEYCPSFLRGFLIGVVSGLWRSVWIRLRSGAGLRLRRVTDALTGGRSQVMYAILLEYPRSLGWVSALIKHSFTTSPKSPELGRQKTKVIHINNALAPGGSERQFVNTVSGLNRIPDVHVIAAFVRLFQFEKSDFYLPLIEEAGVELMTMQGVFAGSDTSSAIPLPGRVVPANIRDQLLYYSMVFRRERPDVVHLWQDETSLLGGLAAVAEGVPRIIMSSRNLAPHRFNYYRHYWKKIYRALAGHPSVILINNSQAGADDYVRWLDISPAKFKVVRNGFLAPPRMKADLEEYSKGFQLRVQNKSRVTVGSVFRFWP
ncbi:MAG: glycosyltransferase, partial [Woeseiaceae bacterium]|nr:glycosyltransferase [Woeseiaceae bacterium]